MKIAMMPRVELHGNANSGGKAGFGDGFTHMISCLKAGPAKHWAIGAGAPGRIDTDWRPREGRPIGGPADRDNDRAADEPRSAVHMLPPPLDRRHDWRAIERPVGRGPAGPSDGCRGRCDASHEDTAIRPQPPEVPEGAHPERHPSIQPHILGPDAGLAAAGVEGNAPGLDGFVMEEIEADALTELTADEAAVVEEAGLEEALIVEAPEAGAVGQGEGADAGEAGSELVADAAAGQGDGGQAGPESEGAQQGWSQHERHSHMATQGATFSGALEAAAGPHRLLPPEQCADVRDKLRTAVNISLRNNGGDITLRLSPERLGELSIRLFVDKGVVRAVIRVDSPEVKALLESDSAGLRESLAAHGLKLEECFVEVKGLPQTIPHEIGGGEAEGGRADNDSDDEGKGNGNGRSEGRGEAHAHGRGHGRGRSASGGIDVFI